MPERAAKGIQRIGQRIAQKANQHDFFCPEFSDDPGKSGHEQRPQQRDDGAVERKLALGKAHLFADGGDIGGCRAGKRAAAQHHTYNRHCDDNPAVKRLFLFHSFPLTFDVFPDFPPAVWAQKRPRAGHSLPPEGAALFPIILPLFLRGRNLV